MTAIVVALIVLLALVPAVLFLRQRPLMDLVGASQGAHALPSKLSPHEETIGPGRDDVVLVPLPNNTGQALVVGSDDALAVFDRSGLTARESRDGVGALPQLVRNAMSVGGMSATEQFQRSAQSGRIVALAPETMQHIAKGRPMYDKSGNLLALVRGDDGRLKHVMRFDKAGAQAVAASNMATLAVTAALSQQLEAISQQLQEMSETLEGMVKDKDRERLSDALAANEILSDIAESVRRRGITEADMVQLATVKHRVLSLQIETSTKLSEIEPTDVARLGRHQRRELLVQLYEKERLEYWLAVQVQADLARTRSDLLNLLWEHHAHPETASALNRGVATAIERRQRRAAEVGEALRALSDPASRTRLDPVRVISRHRLGKAQQQVEVMLSSHGDAFLSPEADPHTVAPSALEAGVRLPVATARPAGGEDNTRS